MLKHEYKFRVMYSDTDQMGTVHHSNYPKYYETARWELFRNIGITYGSIETSGYMLPVVRMNFRFIKPIHYDELLTVKTNLKALRGARMWFTYKLYNEHGELVNEAETELASVCKESWKACIIPEFLSKIIVMQSKHELQHT